MTVRATQAARIVNALTVDVEDYFQVSAFESHIARADWDRLPCRVEANVERILAMLDEHDAHATFFTLGWIAQRYPEMVRRIARAGHELASHGTEHRRASDQTPADFASDIRDAKALLEDIGGGGKRGRRPELWDGRAAQRIARHLASWLTGRAKPREKAVA